MSEQFDLEKQWLPYERLLPATSVAATIRMPVEFAGEPALGVFPSIIFQVDGPKLDCIFLVTSHFLSQVHLDGLTFDYVARRRVQHMRWEFGTTSVRDAGGEVSSVFESARFLIAHTDGNLTTAQYMGNDRATWVRTIRKFLPTTLLLD